MAGATDHERGWGQYQAARCGAVAAAWRVWNDQIWQDSAERLVMTLEQVEVARFLLVHETDGISWFNKERFEELVRWLALRACFEQARGGSSIAVPVADLILLAAGAGYRVRRLIRLAGDLNDCVDRDHMSCVDC